MAIRAESHEYATVALRKESVDRNSRRARLVAGRPNVALRKESVDRNEKFEGIMVTKECRSPQGERG